jgi:hypothetical protein
MLPGKPGWTSPVYQRAEEFAARSVGRDRQGKEPLYGERIVHVGSARPFAPENASGAASPRWRSVSAIRAG